ncbi:hypothetical protein [Nocardia brasiliensis]|uniref:Uncharacterized protein n=1 Tax=Nocardia brasiliensis (strain ATCC 700358 / HUJEG-1) TaxID=1133849 RepID=K0F1K5_NOCB7|nr:hypothetical protein [Nocardia brasiliensis]AFU06103.1 hypothetical protein O3I_040790 [Nocardia brasiliensis ATCC 700358]OCF88694.1 hypothetical protein AW168_20515 [Nocardia brasiliensis]
MPVSDIPDGPPGAGPAADSLDLPAEDEQPGSAARPSGPLAPDVEAVVARWNPQGTALLRAVREGGAAGSVLLIGPLDANTTLLRTELARFEPRIPLADPVAEVGLPAETGSAPASLALILLDAGTTLGADTLRLVRRLRSDGTRILLAMNGIHAYQDWRAVRERDLALLAGQGAGELDILPVSARLAAAARTSGDAGLMDRSGLGALHAQLAAAAQSAEADGGDRLAAVTARVLTETRQRVTEQVTTLRSGAESARLREERAVLLAGRDGGRATAMSTLRGQLHLARVDLMTEVGARIRALHTATRGDLDRLRRRDLTGYPDRLQHAVTELTGGVDQAIDQRLAELAAHIGGVAAPETGLPPRRRDPAPRVGPDPDPRHRGVEDHLMIVLGASAGVGLGRLLVSPFALVPALDVASVPVTLLLGAGAAGWVVRARGQLADRAHVRQWVSDALINVKAQLEQRVATALVETETVLADRVVRASATRMVDTDRRVAEVEARLRRTVAEQPGQLAACERDIEILDRWITPVE